jgi:ribokinase
MARFAVVGHVEWIEFARVSHVPVAGEIIEASDGFEEAAGSAAVAAVQIAKLAGGVQFFTALGADERGRRAAERLRELGVEVHAARREAPQRRGFVHLDDGGERTITIQGERLVPHGADPLPWERLAGADAVFVSGGDPAAVRAARAAKVLVATPRAADALREAAVPVDALVGSGSDRLERLGDRPLDPAPALVVTTGGQEGGRWEGTERRSGRWRAAQLPGPRVDAYGAGDSFAGGLTYALGSGLDVEAALELAARCGAANLTGRGPYAGQLTADRL